MIDSFVVAQEHQIEQTLPAHMQLGLGPRFPLSALADRQYFVREFEVIFVGLDGWKKILYLIRLLYPRPYKIVISLEDLFTC